MNDLIYKQDAMNEISRFAGYLDNDMILRLRVAINRLPSAQQEIIRCKDCEHFHYDMPYVIQGLPVIGHEVCDFWGGGCKTAEDGFCSYAERRQENG